MQDHKKGRDSAQAGSEPSEAERQARIDAEQARIDQDDTLNDVRAEQQMLEGALDTDLSVRRMERDRSRDQDEPDDQLDLSDPVPPKGV